MMMDFNEKRNVLWQNDIAVDIWRKVRKGEMPPGTRLPTHRRLTSEYNRSLVTVQKAIELLMERGIVESVPRKGRFIRKYLPHSYRIGLVFPGHPQAIRTYRWTRYLEAIWAAAERLNRETEWQLVPCFDVEPTENGQLTEGYKSLKADVDAHLFGGLIFCYSPHNLGNTDLLQQRSVPVASLANAKGIWGPGVHVDRDAVFEEAVCYLTGQNRYRLAWLTRGQTDPDVMQSVLAPLKSRYGFFSPSKYIQRINQFQPKWVRHTLKMMFEEPPEERPDGLVIADDHLISAVAEAVQDLGIKVPEDLLVVGYWNFPLAYEGTLPVTRLGVDVIEQLQTALEVFRQEFTHGTHPREIRLNPVSESQFIERYGKDAAVTSVSEVGSGEKRASSGSGVHT